MENIYKKISLLLVLICTQQFGSAQCGVIQSGSTASNMFTLIRNGTSSIAVDKSLNMVVFIHRQDATALGGNSGFLRYDISTDNGATWTLNQGVLNPNNPELSRYPNIAIYNPPANTNTSNVYVSYMAPTINSLSSVWNGIVTGVRQLNGTGTTETYNQNSIGTTWQPHSLVNGAPGVFWAIEPIVPAALSGFNIYKGVWNSGTSDIVWSTNFVCNPPWFPVSPLLTDYNIAFDPTGQTGYFSFLGHVTGGPSQAGLYPVLYKTTNGGTTWTGPIQVDLTKLSCITSNSVIGNVASTNVEHDLVVDVNGDPHLITTVGNATSYTFNYNAWHHMYDITIKNGLWVAHDLGNVNGSPYTFGVSPNFAQHWQSPQAARTADGTKVFFTWSDNTNYSPGTPNSTPDLFGKAYNVVTNSWTQTKSFSACNVNAAGKVLFPHIAPEVLEPNATTFKLAVIYGESANPLDMGVTATFKFLDNVTFAASDFSIVPSPAVVTIQQAPLAIICPNSSITLNVNAGDAIWNTGATTTSLSITSGTATSYSVIAQAGCYIGTATIAVTNLTVNPVGPTGSSCPGNAASFTVTGNAQGYTWTPGNATGTTVTLNPFVNTITLTAMGSSSCLSTHTLSINQLPSPTINVTGSPTVCAGSLWTQTANGASTYTWSDGSHNATFTDTPATSTSYTVTGTAANSCTNMQVVNVAVSPTPNIGASSTPPAICNGQSVTITSTGGVSYSLNSVPSSGSNTVAPTITTVYTVTGSGPNSCESSKEVTVVVNPLPVLAITGPTAICTGQFANFSFSGANTYSWNSVSSSSTATVSPVANTVYTLTGASLSLCRSTETIGVVVNTMPTLTVTADRNNICRGETATLTASGAATYSWSAQAGGVLTAAAVISPTTTTTFSVVGTSTAGCSSNKNQSITVMLCTGLNEVMKQTQQFSIYPNPNSGSFTIKGETQLDLKLVNELGQVLRSIRLEEKDAYQVLVDDLPSGIYFLTGGTNSARIIVNK